MECEGVNTNLHNVHKLEIINTTTNEVYYNTQLTYEQTFRSYEGIHNNPHVGSFSPVVIPPGNWVKIKYTASSKYKTIEARLSLKYNRTIKTEKSPVNFSGARVKNLKSYYASGLTDHIKEFYYNPLNRLEQRGTSLHHFYSFNPWSYNCIKPSCESQQPNPAIDVNCSNLITFSSNNMMDALNERSARINYSYITVKENNKGFVEKNFLINGDVIHGSSGLQHEPPSTVSTSNYNAISDGKVKKVQIFDYNKVRQKSIVNDYGYYDEKNSSIIR
ncbi:hypothetical protein LDL59_05365 [Kaistella anthropi]|nr:hypothetical protein [Kaistella anthropi]